MDEYFKILEDSRKPDKLTNDCCDNLQLEILPERVIVRQNCFTDHKYIETRKESNNDRNHYHLRSTSVYNRKYYLKTT